MESLNKVIIFYPHIGEYGGIERNIIALAEEASRMKISPVLICYYDNIGISQYHNNLETILLGDHWNPFIKGLRLYNWFNKNRKLIKGLPLFFGGKAGFYATIARMKEYALHYTDPPSLLSTDKSYAFIKSRFLLYRSRISDWFTKEGVRRARVCLTMTQWNANELESIYKYPFKVVYQGGLPPAGVINSLPRCSGPVFRIFSICRINSSKNLKWILDVVRYFQTSDPFINLYQKLEVIIAGKGPDTDNLKKITSEMELDSIIQFPGFLSADQVEEEYRNADLFLVPGRQGFGLPVLEALYRHVPVVLNKESRISEILMSNSWVAISENNSNSFTREVAQHVLRIRQSYPEETLLKDLPSEQGWANEIGKHCNWW
ncbi:glycosyltransferase [Adhaeribacter radiodurans]|uniref:Glycosyltransferase n=1 Tax=Adhaeribacter radiodurans TaxID=2745197 RepID=A0A7L7L3P9_9BACT|nr:glycosyltransferase [Adhaeribacter radiodurans]QMU27428.1 glycosyltransferase [Adhaeribacter radiodurans]